MQTGLGTKLDLRWFFLPKNNQWLRRTCLVFAFILFDYFSTLILCDNPQQEANIYARTLMINLGMQPGLTLFVFVANLPIYIVLSLDSHMAKLPYRIAIIIETCVDALFAWFIAGSHFGGGTSWFWYAPDLMRQVLGALLYLTMALLLIKPHRQH